MKNLFKLILLMLFVSKPAFADDKETVSQLAQEKITMVMTLLKDTTLKGDEKNKKIVDELIPVVDFNRMAKISLGKKIWKNINAEQRAEYLTLFVNQVQYSLLEKLALYKDEVLQLKSVTEKKKKIFVLTELVSKDQKTDILFKFAKNKKEGWKSYDLEILGISLIQTYRTQFHSLYKKGGIDLLLEKMRIQGSIQLEKKPA